MAHHSRAAAIAVSNRDTRRRPSPPPLLIAIVPPSCHPLRCCLRCPSQLRLVVTLGRLLSLHLLSHNCLNVPAGCHVASRCATVSFAPAGCRVTLLPPPPLNAPSQCRLASHCATLSFILAGCRITPRCNTTSQHVGWLYVASHHATLMFDPAGCCVTPCCHHHHRSQLPSHLPIHVTADENSQAHEPAAQPVNPAHSREEPCHLPLEGSPRSKPSSMARSRVKRPGKRHQVVGRCDDVGPDKDVLSHAGIVGLDAPPQQATQDSSIP